MKYAPDSTPDLTFTLPSAGGALRLSPTDLSKFIHLEQCERYLRLRLYERAHGARFLRDYGVQPQAIPPLLTRSGRAFEEQVEAAVRERCRVENLAEGATASADRAPDNARLIDETERLPVGEALVLLQPRLQVELGGWLVTGDVDLLRLERGDDGALQVLLADIKSTTAAKMDHRLQVAFYHAMLLRLFEQAGVAVVEIRTGVLYRGGAGEEPRDPAEAGRRAEERDAACRLLGVEALLELVPDPQAYLEAVQDLVTSPDSLARRVAAAPFDQLPFHLTAKCDGCFYNEFCMKRSAEQDDLSLLPHLTAGEKSALKRAGIATNADLADLKQLRSSEDADTRDESAGPLRGETELVPTPGKEAQCRQVATTWPVGPRLDELIHRARRYRRWRGDALEALPFIPGKGHGSLPYCDAEQNPNLVRLYLDAQHDYLHDRVYLLGALVVACEGGVPVRRRAVVHLTGGAPDQAEQERDLLVAWIEETLRAVVELAAPDSAGEAKAPVHLVFYNSFEQKLLLEALSRHTPAILGAAPALYDFMTQLAAYDSPIATFLDQEIRELKNYSMTCQSLQAVAAYLKFDWNEPERYTELFRERLFDYWGKREPEEGEWEWYAARSRFNSQIPLEYAYAAWSELPLPAAGERDDYAPYRDATADHLRRFHARRLEALEWIARDFRGNHLTQKTPFALPDLAQFSDRARSLAQALDEFVTIERHVELGAWKSVRHLPPERRVLLGETLLVRYHEADQDPGVAEKNRENERRRLLQEQYRAEYRLAHPDAAKVQLPPEQKEESDWSQEGLRLRLRLETEGLDCSLDEVMALCALKEGDRLVINRRWTTDERLPAEGQTPFTPTPKQMLYGTRADLARLVLERDVQGKVVAGFVDVAFPPPMNAKNSRGFLFRSMDRPLIDGADYTLDLCPNNIYGFWCAKITEGLQAIEEGREKGQNSLYERIAHPPGPLPAWPAEAAAAQAQFLEGLDALHAAGALHEFEPSKREYIGRHGDAPVLLVQGPPGTGKSYSTAFALFARLQGALRAGREFRAVVSCKTHAATDVLLGNVLDVREKLRRLQAEQPAIFAEYFDPRLLHVPLFRLAPRGRGGMREVGRVAPGFRPATPSRSSALHPGHDLPSHPREAPAEGIIPLSRDDEKAKGEPKNRDVIRGERWCVVGATPGGIYGMLKGKKDALFTTPICDCLILDEASQMNLPEAAMAALPLRPEGQLIVVGDHRQMPPIVQHDWETEPRRTFQEYRAYESLFLCLRALDPPMIRFQESFRLHADMAEFLRREVYEQDGIAYFSRRRALLPERDVAAGFVRAVLSPPHPLVVVVHDEADSQTQNRFEQSLIAPILEALADPAGHNLGPEEGLGVVVPHRAQRAALQTGLPALNRTDPATGALLRSAVDTVERFQGGERDVILISATESDREYLLAAGQFLLDPRRLTVSMSRAKRKLVLVASRSVFSLFSPQEETFAHSQLWKNLLRRTCTVPLWQGEWEGVRVQVWGNERASGFSQSAEDRVPEREPANQDHDVEADALVRGQPEHRHGETADDEYQE